MQKWKKTITFALTISATPLNNAYQGGTFFIDMTTYTKLPISIGEQISILKQRGLSFENESDAFIRLKNISYFRLASYWIPMEQDKKTHCFKPEATFGDVLTLYNFDKELRDLLFAVIQTIEIGFRSRIIQMVSSRYGAFWFADKTLFSDYIIFEKCFSSLQSEITRSKEEFLSEHFRKYDTPPYPPAWKTLEVSSFGTLSKLYCNIVDIDLKKQIARDLGLPQHLYLESWMKSLSVLRNCIAHHARIWNRKFPWKPKMPYGLSNKWIEKTVSGERLYAQLCCMAYLLNVILPDNMFRIKLKSLIARYPLVDIRAMGFPDRWMAEPLWR